MIEVQSLAKHFGPIVAVDDVSFTARPGEVVGFLGPNGAGKSTTMKMIVGFLAPSAGSAKVCGFDVAERPIEVKKRVGYLPEGAPLYADMTPASFLHFIAAARGFSGAELVERVETAVARTEIESVLDRPIETLSKGFKRRVGLAQALLHDPEVLILDEPTDGLDPNQKHEVRALIREMAPRKTIVISTHLLDEVSAVCSRAIVIAGGRLVADSTPAELEARSRLHNAVALTLRGVQAEVARLKLGALAGVASIEDLAADPGAVAFRVLPEAGRPIVAEVSQAALASGWQVEEIKVEQGQLDEVFRSITTSPAAGRG
ncbi:MAG TPA: ABC transporter ATP-binding protein [Alphaproteobacteria bacterium]|nr:ABC transporter ATP-binding protein [Alphaproteobacteria bacterium]